MVMKTLDFSMYRKGVLTNIQKRIGRRLLKRIVGALLADGHVYIKDPHRALHSRMKHPTNDIHDEVYGQLAKHFKLISSDEWDGLYFWMRENEILPGYELDNDLPQGDYILFHPTLTEIQARINAKGGKIPLGADYIARYRGMNP